MSALHESRSCGSRSDYAPLRRVLLASPDHFDLYPNNEVAIRHADAGVRPDLNAARREFQTLARTLSNEGVEVVVSPTRSGLPYQVFTRDIGVALGSVLVLGNFTHDVRREEIEAALTVLDVKADDIRRLPPGGTARFEGGDAVLIDDRTLAVGLGSRTNEEGVKAVTDVAREQGFSTHAVPFEERFLHLDMIFTVVAPKLAVLCSAALPEAFLGLLRDRDFHWVDVTAEGVFEMQCNLLAVREDVALSPASNKAVNRALSEHGMTIIDLPLDTIMMGGGGPRCMSFPILRDDGSL